MVVFTCNNCGDSLQKPKVDKHYSTVCRTFKNLTCVDCLTDFKGEDYTAHIKCVSEKERYAAKGAAVNVVNKGEVKQQQWTDMMMEFINVKTDLTAPQKLIFEIMSNHIINIPRKKMKYMNFVKNAGGNRILYPDIEKVWDMIEEFKQTHNKAEPSKTVIEETNTEANAEPPKKKKKKSKENDEAEPICNQNEDNVKSMKPKKQKLKNLEPAEANDQSENNINANKKKSKNGETEVAEVTPVAEEIVKTKSKKRKSKNLENIETTATELINQEVPEIVTSKKKKLKDVEENESVENALEDQVNENAQKRKKKKSINGVNGVGNGHLVKEVEDTPVNDNGNNKISSNDENANVTTDSISNENASTGTETLADKILKVLKKKGSFSLSKLQKKVLKEYCQESGVEETPKLVKKFSKQLKKIDGIEVSDDNVRLLQV